MTIEGGCQCGAIRYAVDEAQILTLYGCHCRECQRQSGSAFALSMKLARQGFTLLQGTLASWQRGTDRGGTNRGHFCGACGCRIFHDDGCDDGPVISLKAGTLDDTSRLRPVGHIWTRRAQPWVRFEPEDVVLEGHPDDGYAALIAAWRAVAPGR